MMYSRAYVKQSGVLNEAELSIACEGLEESEKDGQKRRLNHVNGTRNLSRCSWVCWGCEKGRDGCCMMDMLDLDQEPEFGRSSCVMEMSVKHSCNVFIGMAR